MRLFLTLVLSLVLCGCVSRHPTPISHAEVHKQLAQKKARPTPYTIVIDSKYQTMTVLRNQTVDAVYTISTSKHGLGQALNSYKTPVGLHKIVEKIGNDVPPYGIFHRRQYTGVVWQPPPPRLHLKDYIVTRVLRLKGLEPGLNAGRDKQGQLVDSEKRAIYIHGTTMEWKIGKPHTKGCIHMRNKDMIDLFNRVPTGTLVMVIPH
ncbi:MAG: putative L,D-transpeptidase ErfK/SrfK [Pseudomonadota bacterium]|jgi:hypothetical protein